MFSMVLKSGRLDSTWALLPYRLGIFGLSFVFSLSVCIVLPQLFCLRCHLSAMLGIDVVFSYALPPQARPCLR
jgi:hypothetical protein